MLWRHNMIVDGGRFDWGRGVYGLTLREEWSPGSLTEGFDRVILWVVWTWSVSVILMFLCQTPHSQQGRIIFGVAAAFEGGRWSQGKKECYDYDLFCSCSNNIIIKRIFKQSPQQHCNHSPSPKQPTHARITVHSHTRLSMGGIWIVMKKKEERSTLFGTHGRIPGGKAGHTISPCHCEMYVITLKAM